MSEKVAVITGGSSGIGLATAMELKRRGLRVYELSRRECLHEGIYHVTCDVTNDDSVRSAFEYIKEEEGKIDILINCAGSGISGAIEFTDTAEALRQINVNFFGMVRCNREVLHYMRENGGGRIVNISSVAGAIPIPFQGFYSASKAAINSYTCALANEIWPYGVSACAIQPGDIASGFTDARAKNIAGDDVYGGRIERSVKVMEHDERTGMSPETAGAYIAKIALKQKVKPLYAIGFKYKFFVILMRLLPCRLSSYMLGMIYAK